MQINYQDQDSEVQTMKKVPRNDKVCTLCEEFANQALDYIAENKTQTEIIDILRLACTRAGSFKGEVLISFSYVDILDKTV
jgi:saposin